MALWVEEVTAVSWWRKYAREILAIIRGDWSNFHSTKLCGHRDTCTFLPQVVLPIWEIDVPHQCTKLKGKD